MGWEAGRSVMVASDSADRLLACVAAMEVSAALGRPSCAGLPLSTLVDSALLVPQAMSNPRRPHWHSFVLLIHCTSPRGLPVGVF